MSRERVLLSYCRDDLPWKEQLAKHLAPLVQERGITLWDEGRVPPGADRRREMERAAAEAKVAVLLVSASFLADPLCKEELRILQRCQPAGLHLVPVLVRTCSVQDVPWLSGLQLLPRGGKAIAAGDAAQRDQDLADVAREIAGYLASAAREVRGPGSMDAADAADVLDDRYSLVELLGEGGQGAVWRARDRAAQNKEVALKLVDVDRAPPSLIERVRREAKVLHRLSHPSLLSCHRLFEDLRSQRLGLVMDYVRGATLEDALTDARWTHTHRTSVLSHLAGALAYLHEKGLVHRDVKPENVLLDGAFWGEPDRPEHVKLIDFGIAAPEGNPKPVTEIGRVIGTFAYMAPESIDPGFWHAPPSAPSRDVFAFGVLGWRILSGSHPAGIESGDIPEFARVYRVAAARQTGWPAGDVPGRWGDILRKCLSLRAADRPATGAQILELASGRTSFASPLAAGLGAPAELPKTVFAAPMMTATTPAAPGVVVHEAARPSSTPRPVIAPVPGSASRRPAAKGNVGPGLLAVAVLGIVGAVIWLVTPGETSGSGRASSASPSSGPSSQTPPASASATATQNMPPSPTLQSPAPAPRPPSRPAPGPVTSACCQPLSCDLDTSKELSLAKHFKVKEDGTCECPSGRTSIPWCCERWIPRQPWSIRVSWASFRGLDGQDTGVERSFPQASVCIRRHDPADPGMTLPMPCVRIADIEASASGESKSLLMVTTDDLTTGGLDIAVESGMGYRLASKQRARVRDIGLGALCRGLLFRDFPPALLPEPKVVVFLDDPASP